MANDGYEQIDLAGLIEPGGMSVDDVHKIAAKIYFAPGFQLLASAMIGANSRVQDYLSQCPTLLSMLAKTSIPRRADHYALLSKQFAWRAAEEPPLKKLMRVFELPFPMRKISGRAIGPAKYWALRMIATCDPRVIASSIPERSFWQNRWLMGCETYRDRLAFHHVLPMADVQSARVEWFIFAFARLVDTKTGAELRNPQFGFVNTVADFVCSQEVRRGEIPFDEKWTFDQALAAASRWHSIINAQQLERTFQSQHGLGIDYEWLMSPWPNEAIEVDGYEFVPLNTGRKISDQATEMHNCLRSYMGRCVNATQYCAWSVRQPGSKEPVVATLGMKRINVDADKWAKAPPRAFWRIDQIEGRRHTRQAAPEIHAACKAFYRKAF